MQLFQGCFTCGKFSEANATGGHTKIGLPIDFSMLYILDVSVCLVSTLSVPKVF